MNDLDSILNSLAWEKSQLLPAIAQDKTTKEVLMLAFISKESLKLSIKSGEVHYFSRSKNRIWKKGEESGNVQKIEEIYIDCDSDTVLFVVNQNGVACHTGHTSCFFRKIDLKELKVDSISKKLKEPPYSIIDRLYHILQEKKFADKEKSYTASLYAKGENTICKKIVEEAGELTFAIKDFKKDSNAESSNMKSALIGECADLIYHTLVGLSYCNISPELVMQELERRFGTSGIDEKNSRKS